MVEVDVGSVSVGVASTDRQTGNKLMVALTSKFGCSIGPEISNFVRWPLSSLSGLTGGSLLFTEEVGEERPLSDN